MWIVLVFFTIVTASIYLLYYELYGHSATKYWDLPAGEALQVVHTAPS